MYLSSCSHSSIWSCGLGGCAFQCHEYPTYLYINTDLETTSSDTRPTVHHDDALHREKKTQTILPSHFRPRFTAFERDLTAFAPTDATAAADMKGKAPTPNAGIDGGGEM